MRTISIHSAASQGFGSRPVRALAALIRRSRQLLCHHVWEPVWFDRLEAQKGEALYHLCLRCHKRVIG